MHHKILQGFWKDQLLSQTYFELKKSGILTLQKKIMIWMKKHCNMIEIL